MDTGADTACIHCGHDSDTQVRLGKDSIGKGSINNNVGRKMSHFTPPTVEEVQEYCFERGNAVDAQSFVDFYTSKGWYVGKTKMKDWKASVRTWEKNQRQKNKKSKVKIKFKKIYQKKTL